MSHPGEPENPMACPRCGQPHARCKGHRRSDGGPCTQPPMPGQLVCYWHGGAKPAARANGEQRLVEQAAEAEVRRLLYVTDADPITDPILALQRMAGRLQAGWDHLGEVINRLEQLDVEASGRGRVEVSMWLHVARELRQALEAMARLGIEDRVTAVLEAQGEQVYELVTAIGRATLAGLVQLLADQPGALEALEAGYERVHEEAARAELGALHELEVGRAP